jgi:hypothetical protein
MKGKGYDLNGRRFGKWTVMAFVGVSPSRVRMWKVLCDCGTESTTDSSSLVRGRTTHCVGCSHRIELHIGQRFSKWTVTGRGATRDGVSNFPWICQCECGTVKEVSGHRLTRGKSSQCGKCSRKENVKVRIRPYEALYHNAGRSAARDNHSFSLSYEEFVTFAEKPTCHYCCASVTFAKHCVAKNGQSYNLDRKDNAIGYQINNVVVCCKRCNHAKGNRYTYEEWYGMTAYFRRPLAA